MVNLNRRVSFGSRCTQRLMVALLSAIGLVCGCSGGSDTGPSPYGSTLLVTYYSDSDCGSELGAPGSRFSVPASGETACTTHATFNHVSLSVSPSDVTCDPANPSSCTVGGGSSIGYKVGCNDDCSVCETSQPSDGSYRLEECAPLSGSRMKDSSVGYLKVTTPTYTGALYLGASEKNPGASIKIYDPVTLASMYLDQSGKSSTNYPTSLLAPEDDSSTLYAALLNDILWQCPSTQSNSCGTWNTTPSRPNMITAANGYIYVAIRNGELWQCPPNSANSCTTYASFPQSVVSLAYDQGSNTLYAGTGCNDCSSTQIYQLSNLGSGSAPEPISPVTGATGECDISVQDMVFGGGQLWATVASKCWEGTGPDIYDGCLVSCTSGSCQNVACGAPYWGATYDPVDNLIFVSQVGYSGLGKAPGMIYKVSASSFDTPTTFANLGNLAEGLVPSTMQSTLPPQALLYAGGYLWIGTGALDCASCSSLFRCPVTADNVNPSCVQVKLNCSSADGCLGAQSMAFSAEVNYP